MIDTDIKLQWRLASQQAGTVDPLLGFFDRRQCGGELQRYHGLKEQPFFQQELNAGGYLLLDDRRFYHNTAPILP